MGSAESQQFCNICKILSQYMFVIDSTNGDLKWYHLLNNIRHPFHRQYEQALFLCPLFKRVIRYWDF